MRTSRSSSVSSVSSTSSRRSQAAPNQQIFIKLISGETIPLLVPATTTLPNLLNVLSLRTSAPLSSLRLVYAGRHLTATPSSSPEQCAPADSPSLSSTNATPTLSSLNVPSGATLHLALPLRGGVTPKKQRCQFKECKDAAQRIVGDCSFCQGHYCGRHRMLEDHSCQGLENCQQEARERNKNTLEGERTSAIKGV